MTITVTPADLLLAVTFSIIALMAGGSLFISVYLYFDFRRYRHD